MENGVLKDIKELEVGDRVASYDISSKTMTVGTVEFIHNPIRSHINHVQFEDGKVLNVTSDHPLYTTEGWKSLDPESTQVGYGMTCRRLAEGDQVMNLKGDFLTITNIEFEAGEFQTYAPGRVSDCSTYFADGLLAHNCGGGGSGS
jgi:hypothetical protein